MVNLDNKEEVIKLQGGTSVLTSVDALPKQLEQSFTESLTVTFPDEFKKVRNIVVCGMGGSQWPALAVKELFKDKITVPYNIVSDYTLPEYVNRDSLVIFSSYSGTTEEPVACVADAKKRGAKIAAIATGGIIIETLKKEGYPVYIFYPTHNPSQQPRIGFGYGVGGHIGFLLQLELLKESRSSISSAIKKTSELLQEHKIDVMSDKNPAKQLAKKLHEKYPYYVVAEFLTGVGNAIQNQTNETAKEISSFRVIPELNHHMMEGLKFPTSHRDIALFIFFFSTLYSEPIQKRFRITKEVVEQNKMETYWYELRGKTKVEQVFELMGFGSYVSMYLSALYGQDPAAIPFVDYFKKRLKE